MKNFNPFYLLIIAIFITLTAPNTTLAFSSLEQSVSLAPGWNIISTPKTLTSHFFSAEETSENFDIYLLDASQENGWATMADLGQTEFMPLFGYFINNKTAVTQILTFVYESDTAPNKKLFERTFSSKGWYSIGVANAEYAKEFNDDRTDTDNPSKILNLLHDKYDLVIDFTDSSYISNRKSPAMVDPWKAAVQDDVNNLNDFRDTKGYAIYIKESDARYSGFQNSATTTATASSTLTIKDSSDDPDATIIQVDENDNSGFLTIFAFDLEASDSPVDITLNRVPVTIQTGAASVADVVSDVRLVINGNTYTQYTWTSNSPTSATLSFDTVGYVLDAGNLVTVEMQVEFKSQEGNYEQGETISASTATANYEAVAEDGVALVGSATGDTPSLRSTGATLEFVSSTESLKANSDTTTADDEGVFVLKFDVTAFETDLWINKTAGFGVTMGTAGANFLVVDSSGVPIVAGTSTAALSSTADTDGTQYKVAEGETETFTLTVNYDPETAGFYHVQLYSLNWATTPINPTEQQLAVPVEDFETDQLSI
jgi:hypothetical protein